MRADYKRRLAMSRSLRRRVSRSRSSSLFAYTLMATSSRSPRQPLMFVAAVLCRRRCEPCRPPINPYTLFACRHTQRFTLPFFADLQSRCSFPFLCNFRPRRRLLYNSAGIVLRHSSERVFRAVDGCSST